MFQKSGESMKTTGLIVLSYGLFVLIGGIIGCFVGKSTVSLISGVVFDVLITINAIKILKGNMKGLSLAMLQSFILGSFFIYRLNQTKSFMPAGLMIIISFAMGSFLAYKLISLKVASKKAD